jgi:hypothetical protein
MWSNNMRWSELTWPEIPAALAAVNHAAILPVGATEQHGPHLGCGVDFVIAESLCLGKITGAYAAHPAVWMLNRTQQTLARDTFIATDYPDRAGQTDR